MNLRGLVFVSVLVVASVGVFFWLNAGVTGNGQRHLLPEGTTGPLLTLTSSADCKACHAEVFAEWQPSHHGIAYTNPEVQKLSKNFKDRDCVPCHTPRPVWETGLGQRVLEREDRIEEGVDCFACHRSGEQMLGATVAPGTRAPCNPARDPRINDMTVCSPCHDQHKTMQDWAQTAYAVPGAGYKDCQTCHMPAVERPAVDSRPAHVGHSHAFGAAHDPAVLRSGASLTVTPLPGRSVEIVVTNDGAGHHFPCDERHRAVDLTLSAEAADGAFAGRVDRFRNPYRDEFALKSQLRTPGATRDYTIDMGGSGRRAVVHATRVAAAFNPGRTFFYPESTQIPAGEARRYTVTLPEGVHRATVRLLYKLNPYVEDDRATMLHEVTVDVP